MKEKYNLSPITISQFENHIKRQVFYQIDVSQLFALSLDYTFMTKKRKGKWNFNLKIENVLLALTGHGHY